MISTLTAEKLLELWLLPVYSYVLAAMGMLLGLAISALFDKSGRHRPVVIASTACGNGFSLPLSMAGALMFSCLGRGQYLYGQPDHDSTIFRRHVGPVPLGGFFCNGEIGPVGGGTFVHGYTSAFALFRRKQLD